MQILTTPNYWCRLPGSPRMTSRRSVPARGRMRPRRGLPYGCGWSSSSEFSFFITYVGVRRTGRHYPQYMNRGSGCGGTSPVLVTMYREPVASSHRSPSKPPALKTRAGRLLPTQRGYPACTIPRIFARHRYRTTAPAANRLGYETAFCPTFSGVRGLSGTTLLGPTPFFET